MPSTSQRFISKPIISADSHILEPRDLFVERIDKKYLDRAPRIVRDEKAGDVIVIPGYERRPGIGTTCGAGLSAEQIGKVSRYALLDDQPRAAWDGKARVAAQDVDGVAAEIIYPSVGQIIAGLPDVDFRKACFDAYNGWLEEFCSAAPNRLFGIGMTTVRTPREGIRDLERFKKMGFIGAGLCDYPGEKDYDDPMYDEFYAAAVELKMPLSFHIVLTMRQVARGASINKHTGPVRHNQDVIGMLIFGGVFERHPNLHFVCVEADAGWGPHFMYRMDHFYDRIRYWRETELHTALSRAPSDYFRDNIHLTFQDDWPAIKLFEDFGPNQLLWANDYPHMDSTWPRSQKLLGEFADRLSEDQRNRLLHDNVSDLYGLPI